MNDQGQVSQSSALASLINVRNLLIVRLSAMGDVLHGMPAIAALRRLLPDTTIGWVVEERWAELLCSPGERRSGPRSEQRPLVDVVHTVNTQTWRRNLLSPDTWGAARASIRDLRGAEYDVAIDLQGAVRSGALARLSGAAVIYGFAQPRENAASMFYTRQVQAAGTHVVEQNCSLARAMAKQDLVPAVAELPRNARADDTVANKLRTPGLTAYAILNPGAGWGAKQWPAERYAEVALRLARRTGLQSMINFGPGEEELARTTETASRGAAKAIATTISELIALTRRAHLFIGGDTGPMHLAALLRIPVVAIFGPTNPMRNGPYGTRSITLRSEASVTSHSRRPHPEQGMLTITANDVVDAAVKLLKEIHG